MPDFRSFAPVADPDPSEIVLSPEESHHLVRVNRARSGDPVVVFNGRGVEWLCECADADRRAARLRVRSRKEGPALAARITLAQALPKGKTLEAIIRKATEIGAAGIVPLVTARTEVRLDEARVESKQEKWEATAIEAAKQSGNSYLPAIRPLQSLCDFLQETSGFDLKLVASLESDAVSLRSVLEDYLNERGIPPAHPLWLVGPEGDFTAEEYGAARGAGFVPITLGPLVMRCETAATYALSILSYELQNR
jgi:16S rRNA (uracil1498-N3)-methyltransferase